MFTEPQAREQCSLVRDDYPVRLLISLSSLSVDINWYYGYDAVYLWIWLLGVVKFRKKTIFETNNTANIFYYLYPDDQQKIFYFFVRSTRFNYKRVILGFWILLLSYCNTADNFPVAVKYISMYFHCYITFFFYLFFHFHLIFIRVRTCIWRRTEKKSKER